LWNWPPALEAFWMNCKGGIECRRTDSEDLRRPPVMYIVRGHKGNARMAMHGVVPVEERPAQSPGVLPGTETLENPGPYLSVLTCASYAAGTIIA